MQSTGGLLDISQCPPNIPVHYHFIHVFFQLHIIRTFFENLNADNAESGEGRVWERKLKETQ